MLVSLLIPTHNRRELLLLTLNSIAEIEVPERVEVEVHVVANACDDDTIEVLQAFSRDYRFPLEVIEEPVPGSSRARNLLASHSRGEVLAYLDDDVLVSPGWLKAVLETFREYPADLVGGRVELWWRDLERPNWFNEELESVMARKAHGDQVCELQNFSGAVTANLAMRREVFQSVGEFRLDLERRRNRMGSFEDMEFLQRAKAKGFRMFYHPRAEVKHYVDPQRISKEYLSGMPFGTGMTRVFMKEKFGPSVAFRALLGHTYLILRHGSGEIISTLRGDARTGWKHRVHRMVGMGGLQGAVLRLLGYKERP
jgi:glycosyltransferase involved in cell wall biosynthesis